MGWLRHRLSIWLFLSLFLSTGGASEVVLRFDGPEFVAGEPDAVEAFGVICVAEIGSGPIEDLCGYSFAVAVSGASVREISAASANHLLAPTGFTSVGEVTSDGGNVGGFVDVVLPESACFPLHRGDRLPLAKLVLEAPVGATRSDVRLDYVAGTEIRLDGDPLVPLAESLTVPVTSGVSFRRGDANADGRVDIADSSYTFSALFVGEQRVACLDAADTNDDGRVDIADGIYTLRYSFLGEARPASPFPVCGPDFTDDSNDCESYPSCGVATITWEAPTENSDGTALRDLAGYKIRFGRRSGLYREAVDVGNVTSYRFSDLVGDPIYAVIIAYDRSGNESEPSEEVVVELRPR